jgi:hypothetical protein
MLTNSTFSIKILTGDLNPMAGHVNRNGRLRVYVGGYS